MEQQNFLLQASDELALKSTLLDVKNLCVDYYALDGEVHAVNKVSFSLRRGEILGLAGESGCGKSTLAYAILRLLRPPAVVTDGQILYYPRDGEGYRAHLYDQMMQMRNRQRDVPEGSIDILQLTPKQLRTFRWNELSIVFQSAMNSLNPVLTVGSQIIDVLRTHRPGNNDAYYRKRAAELFEMVGISADRLKSYPHELSGGMRQRTVIAVALALEPELIIMDEPTTALDVVVQRKILDMMVDLCQKLDTAMIFVTHDLSLLLELADRVAVMYAGNIVEMTPAQELYRSPRHPYSVGLLNSFPTLHKPRKRMSGIPGTPLDLRIVPKGCSFQARCPAATDACSNAVPYLRSYDESRQQQLVACHLYDKRYQERPPTHTELTDRYDALVRVGPEIPNRSDAMQRNEEGVR